MYSASYAQELQAVWHCSGGSVRGFVYPGGVHLCPRRFATQQCWRPLTHRAMLLIWGWSMMLGNGHRVCMDDESLYSCGSEFRIRTFVA